MEEMAPQKSTDQQRDWLAQVCEDPYALKDIPKRQQTDEMVLAAIVETAQGDPHLSLGDGAIAKARVNKEVINELVKKNPWRLNEVPEAKINRSVVLNAIKHSEGHPEVLSLVPKKWATRPIYALAVEEEPLALRYVPNAIKNRKMCTSAVERNPQAIQWVPKGFVSPKLRKAAEKEIQASLALEPKEDPYQTASRSAHGTKTAPPTSPIASATSGIEDNKEAATSPVTPKEETKAAPRPKAPAKKPQRVLTRANPIAVRLRQIRGL